MWEQELYDTLLMEEVVRVPIGRRALSCKTLLRVRSVTDWFGTSLCPLVKKVQNRQTLFFRNRNNGAKGAQALSRSLSQRNQSFLGSPLQSA